jgi:O-antigen ligase
LVKRAFSLRQRPLPYLSASDGGVRQTSLVSWLCALTMVFSLLLGGGTWSGFLSDAILQLAALPLLLTALWRMWDARFDKLGRWALLFCLVIGLLPLLQLIPLPPRVWTVLPNRGWLVETFELIGRELPWIPISVSPRATWLSALSILPPLSLFLGTILLNNRERRLLSLVLLAVGVVCVFVGLLQVAQGPESSLRFFELTNDSEAVGFFANRNHYAALLYTLTLFAAAWAIDIAMAIGSGHGRKRLETASIVALAASFTILVALVAAQAMARSRAGIGLTIIALAGTFALAFWDRRSASQVTAGRLLAGVVIVAMMFATQFSLYRILESFAKDPMTDARIPFARNTIEAAQAFMPVGSGMGSFVAVYGLFEKSQDTIGGVYANRAHNDILELWLETGVIGIGLMTLFAVWLAMRAIAVWRRPPHGRQGIVGQEIDTTLSRSATMVVALLILHSFADYPLRTSAMMTVMAFACALLVDPPIGANDSLAEETATDTRQDVKRQRQHRHRHMRNHQPH